MKRIPQHIKRLLALSLACCLLIGALGPLSAQAEDISKHWAADSINYLRDIGIVQGDSQGNINPDKNITRAEFVTVINRAYELTARSADNFPDVLPGSWYYDEFAVAKYAGYILGDANGNANPDRNITRAEAAVIFSRVLYLPYWSTQSTFLDSESFPNWSYGSIVAMAEYGFITGYPDNTFRPFNNMTRAEAFSILARVYSYFYYGYEDNYDYDYRSGLPDKINDDTVNLVFYQMGDPPPDQKAVENAINEKLLEKFNATVTFKFSTWTDYKSKYAHAMNSGQIDMCYIANWLNFNDYAANNTYADLDDLLDEYAPTLRDAVGGSGLNMCSVNGETFAVPNLWPEYTSSGILYREDLRKKYNLPVPDSLDNMYAYFKGVKDKEPNQTIIRPTMEDSRGLNIAFDAAWVLDLKYAWTSYGDNGIPYGLTSDYATPDKLYDYWNSQDFVDDCEMFKKWYEAGFWSSRALADRRYDNSFDNGNVIAMIEGQNPMKFATAYEQAERNHPDWEVKYIAYGEKTGVLYPAHATQNGTAILRTCKHPDVAIQVLQALMMDEELNHLVLYGIEGTHYEIKDGLYDNSIQQPNNDDYWWKPFDYEGFNTWNLRNGEFRIPRATDLLIQPMFDSYAAIGAKTKWPNVNIWQGFREDYSSYEAERALVRVVMEQYLAPLQAGMVDDVNAAVAEFRAKVKAAGVDKCREGFSAQWASYCREYGYIS